MRRSQAKHIRPARVRRRPVRLFWHDLLGVILDKRKPSDTTIAAEVAISRQPQRADFVVSRKRGRGRPKRAFVLRGFFTLDFIRAMIEYKSRARPFAPGDLHGLVGRGAQYYARHHKEFRGPHEFVQFLLVPSLTAALRTEVRQLSWSLEAVSKGYWRINGAPYTTIVAVVDVVADAEHDDLLRVLGSCKIQKFETVDFLLVEAGLDVETSMARISGYPELAAKLAKNERIASSFLESLSPEKRLKGISAQERLKGLPAEERLKGIKPEELQRAVSKLPPKELLHVVSRAATKLSPKARQQLSETLTRSHRS